MKLSYKKLKSIIRESLKNCAPYDKEIIDDLSYSQESTYVPDDVKKPINKWLKLMGLSKRK